jgi:hypothetical protein
MDENSIVFIIGYGSGFFSCVIILIAHYFYKSRQQTQREPGTIQIQDAVLIHIVPPERYVMKDTYTCLVCLEEYTLKQAIVECTTCHAVLGHASCLDSWFQRKLSCPHCRANFFVVD